MGYLLLEDVRRDDLAMLSDTWYKHKDDVSKKQNLFHDLARILLAVGRVPMPHIGSLTINSDVFVQLSNRPLTMLLCRLENEGIRTGIMRQQTFSSSIDYGLSLIETHDPNLVQQLNAVDDLEDGQSQVATFAAMRATLPQFYPKSTRNGPFILQLTDVHQSNLFVDRDWHIKSIVDLEFAAALPQEADLTPH